MKYLLVVVAFEATEVDDYGQVFRKKPNGK